MRFDRIVSLGWNCEPGLALRALGRGEQRGFFSFASIPFPAMYEIVRRDFTGVFERPRLRVVDFMIEDVGWRISAHNPLQHKDPTEFGITSEGELLDFFARDRQERAARFLSALKTPTAYVVKYAAYEGIYDPERDAANLRALLAEKGAPEETRVLLVTDDTSSPEWHAPGVIDRRVYRFYPGDEVLSNITPWRLALRPVLGRELKLAVSREPC